MLVTTNRTPRNLTTHRRPARLHPFNQVLEQFFDLPNNLSREAIVKNAARDTSGNTVTLRPRANVVELADAFRIDVEMPGFDKKAVDIVLEENLLKISAAQPTVPAADATEENDEQAVLENTASEEKEEKIVVNEFAQRNQRQYKRYFTLSEHIDTDSIEASMQDGILTVLLAKKVKEDVTQRIAIN